MTDEPTKGPESSDEDEIQFRRASDCPHPIRRASDEIPIRASALSITIRELFMVLGGLSGVVGLGIFVYSNIIKIEARVTTIETTYEARFESASQESAVLEAARERYLLETKETQKRLVEENQQILQSISRLWSNVTNLRNQLKHHLEQDHARRHK